MRRFTANQQQFKGRSFTSVVTQQAQRTRNLSFKGIRNQPPSNNTRQTTPPVQPIISNANISQILNSINDIIHTINEIKEDFHKMDDRIQNLEEDAFYYHVGDNWE